jgi:proteasome lid subunit RPN8/RPN11
MAASEDRVLIPPECRALMVAHARREWPMEGCGLLVGSGREVREIVAARNELRSATRYRVDPRDHFAARRRARAIGLEVVGAFHSHPRSEAVPSAADLAEAWPDLIYVIVSVAGPAEADVRAWRLQDTGFVEVPVASA